MYLPPPLRQIYDAWMGFSRAIGRVVSFVILTVLWIVGFGAYAIIGRLIRKKPSGSPATYWLPVVRGPEDSYRNQF